MEDTPEDQPEKDKLDEARKLQKKLGIEKLTDALLILMSIDLDLIRYHNTD